MNANSALPWFMLSSFLLGCGSNSTGVVPSATPRPATHIIKNPEYENWKKFPIGTKVVRRKKITNQEGTVTVTTTLVLLAKTDKQLDVQSQITVVRPDSTQDNPPQLFEFAAEFDVPESMTSENLALPSPLAKKTATERLEVGGQEFDAEVYEWEGQLEMGKVDLKLWRSNDFPGRQIKMLTAYPDPNLSGAEVTTELHIPATDRKNSDS